MFRLSAEWSRKEGSQSLFLVNPSCLLHSDLQRRLKSVNFVTGKIVQTLRMVLDEAGVIRSIDSPVRDVLHREPSEIVGLTICELFHPDDRARVAGYMQENQSLIGVTVSGFGRVLHHNGTGILVSGAAVSRRPRAGRFHVDLSLDCIAPALDDRADAPLVRVARGVAHDLSNLIAFLSTQTLTGQAAADLIAMRSALEQAQALARSLSTAASSPVSEGAPDA